MQPDRDLRTLGAFLIHQCLDKVLGHWCFLGRKACICCLPGPVIEVVTSQRTHKRRAIVNTDLVIDEVSGGIVVIILGIGTSNQAAPERVTMVYWIGHAIRKRTMRCAMM